MSTAEEPALKKRKVMAATEHKDEKETVNLQHLLSACFDLAERGGDIVRGLFDQVDLDIADKAKQQKAGESKSAAPASASEKAKKAEATADPQTIADLRSQQLIIGSLRKAFPKVKLVGEEGELVIEPEYITDVKTDLFADKKFPAELQQTPVGDLAVWIDPLDGTKEFTLGIKDAVTVLIGVSVRGKAVGGVVHVPFAAPKPRTVWGCVGVGAFGIQRDADVPKDRRWIVTSRSHMTPAVKQLIEKVRAEKMLQQGGAGSKGLMVLEGKADAYFFPQDGTKRWDTCAIDAIFHSIGACLTDAYGKEITYEPDDSDYNNSQGVLGTNSPAEHKTYTLDAKTPLSKF